MKTIKFIVFGLSMLLSISSFAQSFTPVEYRFSDTLMVNQFGFGIGTVPSTDYFTYSAANGYGNWCVSASGLWFLMSNNLGDSTAKQTSGEVAKGLLGFVDPNAENQDALGYKDIKVATNLNGDVRYVWPLTTNNQQSRKSFIVKGFSDKLRDTVAASIDISFVGFPKPALNRQVIKSPSIKQYKTIPAGGLPVYKANLISFFEQHWQNTFDIAMDARYLYITWQTKDSVFRIWYTVVDINKDSVIIPPTLLGVGRRPTIACDIRNNENASNPSPAFDIAYISAIPAIGINWSGNEVVRHFTYFNGAAQTDKALSRLYYNPTNLSIRPRPSYAKPMHARMLVASTEEKNPRGKAVYVIADDGDSTQIHGNLYMHNIQLTHMEVPIDTPTAHYIDGVLINRHPDGLPDGVFNEVYNTPVVAFANPYDGESNYSYDEFHCMYAVDATGSPGVTEVVALHIIRGIHNSYNTGLLNDKRVILNKIPVSILSPAPELPPIAQFTGSVNQMGIHTNWYSLEEGERYYKRDSRRFDEDITENTLVTGTCIIGNGENHDGKKAITLDHNRQMTVWSDPIFIGHNNDNLHRRGKLAFENSGVSLNVGYDSNTTSEFSTLTVLPNYEIAFSTTASDSHKINIYPKSVFHCYGSPIDTSTGTVPNISGTGKIILNNLSTFNEGNLIVHGGALLVIPDKVTLELKPYSKLRFKMEQSIYPPLPDTSLEEFGLNILTTGKLRLHGTFIANGADVRADIWQPTTVIEVKDPLASGTGLPTTQFSAYGSGFTGGHCDSCGYDHGLWGMGIAWTSANIAPTHQFRKIAISNSTFQGTSLSITNPSQQVRIDSSSFWRSIEAPISFNWLRSTNGYGNIFITNNNIELEPNYYGSPDSIPSGIELTGFRQKREDGIEKITISDNYLISDGPNPYTDIFQAAIMLKNTSALVLRNYVYGAGFNNGIVNKFTPPSTSAGDRSNTMFCSNHISGCENGAGLLTENWKGHARMNVIEECLVGHQSEDKDEGGVMYSRYSNNLTAGLSLATSLTQVDLSGIHTSIDKPAYDTLNHNNTLGCDSCGQIITNNSKLLIGTTSIDSTVYNSFGHNTLILSDTNDLFINNLVGGISIGYHFNYWGIGSWGSLTPVTNYLVLRNDRMDGVNLTFIDTLVPLPIEPFINPDTPSCGVSYDWGAIPHIDQEVQSVQLDSDYCRWLEDRVNRNSNGGNHKITVDSGKLFIEQCANYHRAYDIFSDISYSMDFLKYDSNRYIHYAGWLKNVLYLNTQDSNYWCADVSALVYTFHYIDSRGKGDGLGAIAILKYVRESGRCIGTGLPDDYEEDYRFYMNEITQHWRDTVTDSIATPLDTTLPSLEDLDLEILRGKSGVVSGGAASNAPRLSYVTAERNPFTDEVALKVELTTSTMLRLDIYDELGRSVYGEGLGYKPKGDHRFSVDGKAWADGVYYARISTSGGEIRTVKLIKQ